MPHLLTVDPGLNGCGVALFEEDGGELLQARYLENHSPHDEDIGLRIRNMGAAVACVVPEEGARIVSEWPRMYPGRHVSGHALLSLAGVVGAVFGAARHGSFHTVTPPEWKGNLDADAMITRIRGRLSVHEARRILYPEKTCTACRSYTPPFVKCKVRACLAHNVFDAIGIGLWAVGRLEARKAVAR